MNPGAQEPAYPPAPWRLTGASVQVLRLVDVKVARQFVPDNLRIVPILPGKTLAALYCAQYRPPSSLAYHELAIAPALVYARAHLGFWISNIYVDHPGSQAGGRAIWGLPKKLAEFRWRTERPEVVVSQGSLPLCTIRWSTGQALARLPLKLPVISQGQGGLQYFDATGHCTLCRRPAEIRVEGRSPFAPLGFELSRKLFLAPTLVAKIKAPRRFGCPTWA
jgi:hypothetical protein